MPSGSAASPSGGRLEGRPLALRGHHAHHGAGGRHGPALRAAAGERAPDELLYMSPGRQF